MEIVYDKYRQALNRNGFVVVDKVFSDEEVNNINEHMATITNDSPNFRKTNDLFAVRKVFKEIPDLKDKVFSETVISIIDQLFGADYFLVKALYFDKPAFSNWFVSYHQDLSISVNRKEMLEGFGQWTVKNDQYGVQPPLDILESIYTIRIHLDNCTKENGALQVVAGSHKKGIYRAADIDWSKESETICEVPKGGVMIMRPLLLHASGRSTTNDKRKVLHLEFCNKELPASIGWAEKLMVLPEANTINR